jgi:hypothetical protein
LHLIDQILAVLVRLRRKKFVFYAVKPFKLDPALLYSAHEPTGYFGQSWPGISGPPGYFAHGGGYSGLKRLEAVPLKFSKIEVLFDEKIELVCIERMF